MLISKPMAALIGGLLFAVVLGFIPKGCDASAQSADYSVLNPEQGQTTAERLKAQAIAQPLPLPTNPDPWAGISDQERLRGDAEIPQNQAAE